MTSHCIKYAYQCTIKIHLSYSVYIHDLKPWSHFHCMYLYPVILFLVKIKIPLLWPPQNYTTYTNLPICNNFDLTYFNSTYVQPSTSKNTPTDSTIQTLPQTHTHTHILMKSKRMFHWFQIMFLSFQHQMLDIRASTLKNAQENARNQKSIPDSGFRYTNFTDKPHTRTLFQNSIPDSWFLISCYLTFNPARTTHTRLNTSGIRFKIPVCISIYLVKRVKPKYTPIHLWMHNITQSLSAI